MFKATYGELSPNYSGIVASIVSAIGNSMGFLSPMIVAAFVDNNVSIVDYKELIQNSTNQFFDIILEIEFRYLYFSANNTGLEGCVSPWKCHVFNICNCLANIWFI